MEEIWPKKSIVEEGIILVDKPKGISSFGTLGLLRKGYDISKKVKIGHAGTLDPMATGLLVVGVGKGTKILKNYIGLPKTYVAEVLLGIQTDTGDIEGKVLRNEKVRLKKKEVEKAVENIEGKWILPVPIYSATKQGGEPLYKKAREGKKLVRPNREMEIFESKFLHLESASDGLLITVELTVSSGTYIRSIAEEFGRRLDVPATLANLRRTRIGEWGVDGAIRITIPQN
jgi:tRNA pseudouridine55 synthase